MSRGNGQLEEAGDETLSWDDDGAVVIGRDDVSDFNEENILPQTPEVQEAIRSWLNPTSYDAENGEFKKHLASYLPGTGEWLLKSPVFTEWHSNDKQGMLWIKGIPGSGKSVLAASLVDHLSKEEVPVLYFFFRQIIDANHTPDALLRDWLAQVLVYSPPLQARLREYTEQNRALSSVSMADMWQDLRAAMVYLPKVYCVVDALDEMDSDRDTFLQALAELGRWRPSRVKVIITSRPVAKVERPLRHEPMLQIRLDETHVDQDIASYVAHRLHRTPKTLSTQKIDVIKQAVPGRANGLFLYAKLAMDAFLEQGADVDEVLKALPTDLNVMYTNLLREHARRSGVPHDLQLLILSFVTHASRPLRLLEIAEMIQVVDKTQGGATGRLEPIKDLVRAACGPLLEILPDETVCVVHHSLTEFLNGSTRSQETPGQTPDTDAYPILDMNSTHTRLALCCLSHLLCGCLDEVKLPTDEDYETDSEWGDRMYVMPAVNRDLRLNYPFLAYSMNNWHVHARKADGSGPLSEELYKAITALFSGNNLEALIVLSEQGVSGRSPLHIASGLGLSQYVARFIETDKPDVNMIDSSDKTAIYQAAGAGHASVVKVLLANGAEPDVPSRYNGKKPLHVAAANDHGEVVDLLLAAGVDPLTEKTLPDPGILCGDPQKTVGHTPLMYAMSYGRVSAAKAFLPYLKDTETVSRALAWATGGSRRGDGCPEIVEAILEHPLIDVNAVVRGETALYLAAQEPDIKSMIALLKAGADPKISSSSQGEEFGRHTARRRRHRLADNRTPLHALCGANRSISFVRDDRDEEPESLLECLSLMLKAGVDINAKDGGGMAALHHAVHWWPNLVRALVEAGADANITGPDGSTPLHGCYDLENARILVEEGKADINKRRDSDGRTPFLSMVKGCSEALVRLYIDLGADLTISGDDGKGALHICVSRTPGSRDDKRAEALAVLLSTGIPVNDRDVQGRTAMHYLSSLGCDVGIVEQLAAAGADLNARDNQGRTPIFAFVKQVQGRGIQKLEETNRALDKLVSLGARLDLVDYEGFNLLFALVENNSYSGDSQELIRELITRGLDAKSRDNQGNTLLHEAMAGNRHDSRGNLIELPQFMGIDPDQQNYAGQSALHLMLSPRHDNPTEGLEIFQNIDVKDNDGVRPLHVAAKYSDSFVHELLAAGASPTEPTREGVTPLHVAVRFHKSEIVGILLEAIETKVGKEGLTRHLNAFHRLETPTALHMACQSGVPETVALLLAAGADPNLTSSRTFSPLRWCLEYESERGLWDRDRQYGMWDEQKPHTHQMGMSTKDPARGIRVGDPRRQPYGRCGVTTRLEEILDMLCAYGADMVTSRNDTGQTKLDEAISLCDSRHDYTMECLVRLRQKLEENADGEADGCLGEAAEHGAETSLVTYVKSLMKNRQGLSLDDVHKMAASIYRCAATRDAFVQAEPWSEVWSEESSTKPAVDFIRDLLDHHAWGSIKHMLLQEPRLLDRDEGWRILKLLVDSGHESIVRDVVTREEMDKLQTELRDGLRRAEAEGKECLSQRVRHTHPLIDACGRSSGNMPMLRCLVEELGVDVNDGWYSWPTYGLKRNRYEQNNTALNECCKGEYWWQVAEALPYLIERGANLETRDSFGRTALLWALGLCSSPYRHRVVRTLVEAGADVNAAEHDGKNCLARAGDDIEITLLLLKHGATGSIDSLASAIESANATVIKALLDTGSDPNAFEAAPEGPPPGKGSWITVTKTEVPPIFLAAMRYAFSSYSRINHTLEHQISIVQMLLEHGADPFATWVKRCEPEEDDFMHEVFVLHQILFQGGIVQPFLDLPDLDLEHRDANGRTLLLSACSSPQDPDIDSRHSYYDWAKRNINIVNDEDRLERQGPTVIETLIKKGADITARDNKQRNALHLILAVPSFAGYESIQLLLSKAPELLHQTDAAGETPLHYALRRASTGNYPGPDTKSIEMLLEAGADAQQVDANGDSALHHLARWLASEGQIYGQADKPRYMFKHFASLGVPINGRNKRGETPAFSFLLHGPEHRSEKEDLEMDTRALELLAEAGADLFAVNDQGETLLHAVAGMERRRWKHYSYEFEPVVVHRFQWLKDRGLDPMAEDAKSRTSLDVAAAKENNCILAMFERPS